MMLETYAINIVVETKAGDFYKEVAINPSPIIIFGRESELRNLLGSDQVREWMHEHFRSEEMFNKAHYYISHCTRDNNCIKTRLKCSELTVW